eukprot:2824719-Amphidinium_carterae.2
MLLTLLDICDSAATVIEGQTKDAAGRKNACGVSQTSKTSKSCAGLSLHDTAQLQMIVTLTSCALKTILLLCFVYTTMLCARAMAMLRDIIYECQEIPDPHAPPIPT